METMKIKNKKTVALRSVVLFAMLLVMMSVIMIPIDVLASEKSLNAAAITNSGKSENYYNRNTTPAGNKETSVPADGGENADPADNDTSEPDHKDATYLKLNRNGAVMNIGEKIVLTADTDGDALTWTSSNSSVATVSDGVVYAKKGGTSDITVRSGKKTAKCTVTVKLRPSVKIECSLSKQTITIEGKGHAFPDATSYKYLLRAKSKDGKVLKTVKKSSGKVVFKDLNVGEKYYVQVEEYNSKYIYASTQKFAVRTPSKAAYPIYKTREKLGAAIENKAIARAKKFVAYCKVKKDVYDVICDRPLLVLDFSRLADVYGGNDNCNKYSERIKINGQYYYKYEIEFSDYQYTKSQQKKYISKIKSLANSLNGTSAEKVRKFNEFIKTTKYDWDEKNRYDQGNSTDSPTSAYSAYATLIKKNSVCQGQAAAAAIVLNRAGVKCESVWGKNLRTGNDHAWNIVKSGKKWYWCDFCYSIFGNNEILMGSKEFNKYHKLDKSGCAEQMSRVGTIAS